MPHRRRTTAPLGNTACNPPYYACPPRKYGVSVPLAYVVPQDTSYEVPILPTPNLNDPLGMRYWTGRPSYLNFIGNYPQHPLHYMAYRNLQQY
uniref:Uncharacterized protein n=1 Tax=viral metagenome TaxID=1070528 RepID=A0A6C0BMC9_9ZZZZ